MKKMAITISGMPAWNRYLIVQEGGRFWSGKKWTRHRHRARLYAENQDVALVFRELEERLFKDKPLRTFQATVNIRVRAGQQFDIKALSTYLQRAVSIMIDHDKGTGPVQDSLVQLDVIWDLMCEVASENRREKR